ncbi:MAG: hypothetical protein MJK15_03220 [Colwellia sp.]|nr:hypothetical protein [Colwellia sp.]
MPLLGLKELKKDIANVKTDLNGKVRTIFTKGLIDVVDGTPVDEGTTKNNWFLTTKAPSIRRTKNKSNGTGNASFTQILKMPKIVLGKTIFFTNNSPNINVLEFGGYPVPVKKGTYNKKTRKFEIRSINGFSKQAPKGWVRIAVLRMKNKLRSA